MVCERAEGSGSLVYLLVRVCQVAFCRMAEACTMEQPGRSPPAVLPHNITPSPAGSKQRRIDIRSFSLLRFSLLRGLFSF